jgi:hypothetical protein
VAVIDGFTRSGLDLEALQMTSALGHAHNERVVLVTDTPRDHPVEISKAIESSASDEHVLVPVGAWEFQMGPEYYSGNCLRLRPYATDPASRDSYDARARHLVLHQG